MANMGSTTVELIFKTRFTLKNEKGSFEYINMGPHTWEVHYVPWYLDIEHPVYDELIGLYHLHFEIEYKVLMHNLYSCVFFWWVA